MPKTFNQKEEELKKLLNDPVRGLKESSNTNKTYYNILALFDESHERLIAEIKGKLGEKKNMTGDEETEDWCETYCEGSNDKHDQVIEILEGIL